MDRLLKPKQPKISPEEANANKVFDYWFKTFENFITAVLNESAEPNTVDRLALIINFLPPRTYPCVESATSY